LAYDGSGIGMDVKPHHKFRFGVHNTFITRKKLSDGVEMPQTCYYCKRTIEDENNMVVKSITDILSFQNEQLEPFHSVCWQERSRKKRKQNIIIATALISVPVLLFVIPLILSYLLRSYGG
jgi:hypothetical protein